MTPHELQERRRQLNMSQTQLADVLGVGQQTLTRWETGQAALPKTAAMAIEHLFCHHRPSANDLSVPGWLLAAREKYGERGEVTHNEAAEYLGVNERTLLGWVKDGRIARSRRGVVHDGRQSRNTWFYRREELERFLEQSRIYNPTLQRFKRGGWHPLPPLPKDDDNDRK